jgi:hypothetical protein
MPREPEGLRPGRHWAFLGIFALLLAVAIAPAALAEYPGLINYPNLVARVFIISSLPSSDLLAQYYQLHSKLVPNLAFDVTGPLLMALGLPAEQAGRLFTALSIVSLCGGTVLLAWAAQRQRPWLALGIFAFAINGYLIDGFLNYIFGLGLALTALALWLLKTRETVWTAVLFSLLPCLLLLCHLIAFGVYALGAAAFLLNDWRAGRQTTTGSKLLREALCFLPAVLMYALFFEHRGTLGLHWENPLKTKLAGLLSLFCATGGREWDLALIALTCAAAAFLWHRSGITFSSRGAAAATAAMLAAFVLAPNFALGFWFLDSRLALPLLCFALAFARPRNPLAITPKAAALMLLGLATVAVQRAAATAQQWQLASQTYGEVRRAMTPIEPGARIATVVRNEGSGPQLAAAQNSASFAIVDHSAFVPDLDAFPLSQDSIAFNSNVVDDARSFRGLMIGEGSGPAPDWAQLAARFDYVLFLGGEAAETPATFRPVTAGKNFLLLSARRTALSAPPRAPGGSSGTGGAVAASP